MKIKQLQFVKLNDREMWMSYDRKSHFTDYIITQEKSFLAEDMNGGNGGYRIFHYKVYRLGHEGYEAYYTTGLDEAIAYAQQRFEIDAGVFLENE